MKLKKLLFIVFLLIGCDQKSSDAEGVLRDYINKRFANKITQSNVDLYVARGLLKEFEKLSEKKNLKPLFHWAITF